MADHECALVLFGRSCALHLTALGLMDLCIFIFLLGEETKRSLSDIL